MLKRACLEMCGFHSNFWNLSAENSRVTVSEEPATTPQLEKPCVA